VTWQGFALGGCQSRIEGFLGGGLFKIRHAGTRRDTENRYDGLCASGRPSGASLPPAQYAFQGMEPLIPSDGDEVNSSGRF